MDENKKIWKCPRCETLNQEEYCVVCGEKRMREIPDSSTKYDNKEEISVFEMIDKKPPVAKKSMIEKTYDEIEASSEKEDPVSSRKYGVIAIIIALIMVIMMIVLIASIGLNYSKAAYAANNQNYSEALQYLDGITIGKANELKRECRYQYALQLLNNGSAQTAKNIFLELGDYKESEKMSLQCDYNSAEWYFEQGDFFKAYEIFEQISDFSDSKEKMMEVSASIYTRGIELYRSGNLDEAKKCFEKSAVVGREKDYLLLIQVGRGTIVDISRLYDLIDFENTKSILASNSYILQFLKGKWINKQGYYINFYNKEDKYVTWCDYLMPLRPNGDHWKIDGGKHYYGSDSEGWTEYWTYNIISKNLIEITLNSSGLTYKFTRE